MKIGGLPLVWGMTIFARLIEIRAVALVVAAAPVHPPESAGLVVFLVGVIIGLAALRILLEDNPAGIVVGPDAVVAGCLACRDERD